MVMGVASESTPSFGGCALGVCASPDPQEWALSLLRGFGFGVAAGLAADVEGAVCLGPWMVALAMVDADVDVLHLLGGCDG